MEKLKAIIVDDEENARILLKQRLNKFHPEVDVKDLCESAKDALLSVIKYKPDIVFLDIQMPDMSGLEFFEDLSEVNLPIQAIITTAFAEPEYYKKAIQLGLADYLLKPIIREELDEAINNVKARIEAKAHLQQVNKLVNVLKTENKISLTTGSSRIFVRPVTIVYARSDGKFSKIFFTSGEEITVMHGIGELADLLPVNQFVRIDRFTIVNLSYVHKISPRLRLLTFEFNERTSQLPVSHTGAIQLLELMDGQLNERD